MEDFDLILLSPNTYQRQNPNALANTRNNPNCQESCLEELPVEPANGWCENKVQISGSIKKSHDHGGTEQCEFSEICSWCLADDDLESPWT